MNAIGSMHSKPKRDGFSSRDLVERTKAIKEVHEWSIAAGTAGLSLRCDLTDFIGAVEQLDPSDSLFWQRVYTLIGLEYSVAKKRSFWSWFS